MNAGHILGTRGALLRWFNPEEVLKTIQEFRAEAMSGRAHDVRLPPALSRGVAVRHLLHAGLGLRRGAASRRDRRAFRAPFGGKLLEGYGLTEASPVVSAHRLSGVRKLGSVGQPIPGVTVSIRDDGDTRPAGRRSGRGLRQGPQRDARLLPESRGDGEDDSRRLAPHRRHGAARRGQLPVHRRAQEGPDHPRRLQHLSARRRGGALRLSQDRRGRRDRAAGRAHGRGGRRVRRAQARADGDGRRGHRASARRRLAKYKCPKEVRFVDALPKSPVGKILRKELRGQVRTQP